MARKTPRPARPARQCRSATSARVRRNWSGRRATATAASPPRSFASPAAVVETGPYRGTTTLYFRRTTRVPVHSSESKPRHYGFARAHLWRARGVYLYREDSRAGLARLAAVEALSSGPVFFYFDAHGQGDLPLSEEVDLAFAHWPQAVIMIDDFEVPDDPGYAFDDYGPGKALTLAYLGRRAAPPVAVWFPACTSSTETGA